MSDNQNQQIMNKCPYCGKQSMSFWKKCFLGAARSTECEACGEKIGIPWTHSLIALLPLVVVFFATTWVESSPVVLLLIILAAIPMFLMHGFWVPIIKK